MLARFALPALEERLLVDIIYISCLFFLGVALFTIPRNKFTRLLISFSLISFLLNLISFINGYASPFYTLYTTISFIFFPAFLAIIICRGPASTLIYDFVNYFVLPMIVLNLLVAFIELNLRDIAVLSGLQIAGRSYELIGLIIASLLLASTTQIVKTRLVYLGYFITTIISFSRGAAFVFTIIFFNNLTSSAKGLIKWIGILIFVVVLIIFSGITNELIDATFGNILQFWSLRLNLVSDYGLEILSSGRLEIYSNCFSGFLQYPVFGVGMGQSQNYFITNYSSTAFSGCHNIWITPLLERGLTGTVLYWFLLGIAIFRVLRFPPINGRRKHVFFLIMFILYASSTGAEFFILSSSVRNANILLVIMMIIFVFNRQKKLC